MAWLSENWGWCNWDSLMMSANCDNNRWNSLSPVVALSLSGTLEIQGISAWADSLALPLMKRFHLTLINKLKLLKKIYANDWLSDICNDKGPGKVTSKFEVKVKEFRFCWSPKNFFDLLGPRKHFIMLTNPNENLNSTSSWKSEHKLLQLRRGKTSKLWPI